MIHINKYYIVDPANELSLKSYHPKIVKVVKRHGFKHSICIPIEPVVYPCREDGWMSKTIIIPNRVLKPYDFDKEVVIRYPENLPSVSEADIENLNYIANILMNGGNVTKKHQDTLLATIEKLKVYRIIGDEKRGKNSN